jgi:hypothetical protein
MTGHRTEPLQTVTTVRKAAETLGFMVTENPDRSNGHLTLDITRTHDRYEYVASFRRKDTGYWAWEFGYDYREDPTLRVHTMTRFIERLRSEGDSHE